jgi:Rod binding domain-containing protein
VADLNATITLSSGFNLALHQGDLLLSRMRSGGPFPANGKVEKAAQDFESMLLNQWLQQARESFASVPGGSEDEDGDTSLSQLQEIGMQALATAVTKSGGIGIAKMLGHQLQRQIGAAAAGSEAARPPGPSGTETIQPTGPYQQEILRK